MFGVDAEGGWGKGHRYKCTVYKWSLRFGERCVDLRSQFQSLGRKDRYALSGGLVLVGLDVSVCEHEAIPSFLPARPLPRAKLIHQGQLFGIFFNFIQRTKKL